MSHQAAGSARREDGTASVEMVAVIPFLLLAVLVAAQIGLAGHALWSASVAARAGARAALVGGEAAAAARRALPPSMRDGAEVSDGDGVSDYVDNAPQHANAARRRLALAAHPRAPSPRSLAGCGSR